VLPLEMEMIAEVRRWEIAQDVAALRGDRAPSPPPGASGVRVRAGRALVGLGHLVAPELRPTG